MSLLYITYHHILSSTISLMRVNINITKSWQISSKTMIWALFALFQNIFRLSIILILCIYHTSLNFLKIIPPLELFFTMQNHVDRHRSIIKKISGHQMKLLVMDHILKISYDPIMSQKSAKSAIFILFHKNRYIFWNPLTLIYML